MRIAAALVASCLFSRLPLSALAAETGSPARSSAAPADSVTVDVSGRVIGSDSVPLPGASAALGGLTAVTDVKGMFRLQGRVSVGLLPAAFGKAGAPRLRNGRLEFFLDRGGPVSLSIYRPDGRTVVAWSRRLAAGPQALELKGILPAHAAGNRYLFDLRRGAGPELLSGRLDGLEKTGASAAEDSVLIGKDQFLGRKIALTAYTASLGDIRLLSNVALGKPASAEGALKPGLAASLANDSDSTNASCWGADGFPSRWQVDLQDFYRIARIKVRTFADGRRGYAYEVQSSLDGKTWSTVAAKAGTDPASPAGEAYDVDVKAAFLRVNVTSASGAFAERLADFKAFGERLPVDTAGFNLVPWPQTVQPGTGRIALPGSARIVATDPTLLGVAGVLSEEIRILTGRAPAVAQENAGKAGDIVLRTDPLLPGKFQSRTDIGDIVSVTGKDARAVAMGSANLLQLLSPSGTLPRGSIRDNSAAEYSEVMLDVGRQYNGLDVLKRCIVMCRLYKIPFFRLHLTDDQLWMFQSLAYPELGRGNAAGAPPYTQAELKELVRFAEDRGVAVVPEIECLGHSTAMRRDRPDLFGTPDGKVLQANMVASDSFYAAMSVLMREVADVFSTSPYIHIGEDEAGMGTVFKYAGAAEYLAARHINTETLLWVDHISRMNEVVKGAGRKTALWEGFSRPVGRALAPKSDYLIFEWDGKFYNPDFVKADGFSMVNVSWNPSVYSTEAENYAWNLWLVGSNDRIPDQFPIGDPSIIGGSMVLWERPGGEAIPLLRSKTPARQERIYNPGADRTFADFQARFRSTDAVLQKLMSGVGAVAAPVAYMIPNNVHNYGRWNLDAGPTAPYDFKIVNNGDADMIIESVGITGVAPSPYTIIKDTGEGILKPGKVRTVGIVFDPFPGCMANGNYLTAKTNDPAHPVVKTWMIAGYD